MLPALAQQSSSDFSSRSSEFDVESKFDSLQIKRSLTTLSNFKPQTDLDRSLLLGIIQRDKPYRKTRVTKRKKKMDEATFDELNPQF